MPLIKQKLDMRDSQVDDSISKVLSNDLSCVNLYMVMKINTIHDFPCIYKHIRNKKLCKFYIKSNTWKTWIGGVVDHILISSLPI